MPVKEVKTPDDLKRFIKFEAAANRNNDFWVPNLERDVAEILTGRAIYSSSIKQRSFFYERDSRILARVAVFINQRYIDSHKKRVGFFGYFEALPKERESVRLLLEGAGQWLDKRNIKTLIGPINGDIQYGFALQADNYQRSPAFPYFYSQPYYLDYFEEAGFVKQYSELCYKIDLLQLSNSFLEEEIKKSGINVRPVSFNNFAEDCRLMTDISNEAFKGKWYFAPYDLEESVKFWTKAKPLIKPSFFLIGEKKGSPVGCLLSFPDYNPVLKAMKGKSSPVHLAMFLWRKRAIRQGTVFVVAVLPGYQGKGVGRALVAAALLAMRKQNYRYCFYQTVTAANLPSRKLAEFFGGKIAGKFLGLQKEI